MTANILDGHAHAQIVIDKVASELDRLPRAPGLAVVLVGCDAASQIYAVVADAKPAEQPAQAQPQAAKKHKVARYHAHPQQPMRLAQPGTYQPYRVAQQQPRMGFFGGFGTW